MNFFGAKFFWGGGGQKSVKDDLKDLSTLKSRDLCPSHIGHRGKGWLLCLSVCVSVCVSQKFAVNDPGERRN